MNSIGGCSWSAMMAGDVATTYRSRLPVWHGSFALRNASGSRRWRGRGSALRRRRSGWAVSPRRCSASSTARGLRPIARLRRRLRPMRVRRGPGIEAGWRSRFGLRGAAVSGPVVVMSGNNNSSLTMGNIEQAAQSIKPDKPPARRNLETAGLVATIISATAGLVFGWSVCWPRQTVTCCGLLGGCRGGTYNEARGREAWLWSLKTRCR